MPILIKNILPKSLILKSLDFFLTILAIIALFYEIGEYIPSEPAIILELEELEAPFAYSLTGADSDQNYLLDSIKIYPYFDHPIKRATFKYDRYIKEVDLTVSQQEQPHAYFISKVLLQSEFEEPNFQFEFLDDNRLTFNFQFEEGKQNKPNFECKVGIVDKSVPCKVVEKSFFSSWYYTMGLSAFMLAIVIFWWFFRLIFWKNTPKYGHDKGLGGYGSRYGN